MKAKHYVMVIALIGGASVLQYYFGPKKIKEVERVRVVEKVRTIVKSNVVTKRVTEEKPDGSRTTTEVIVDKSTADRSNETQITKVKERKVTPQAGKTLVFGGVSPGGSQSYALGLQRDILGPIGVFGMGTFNERTGLGGFVGFSLKF